ncbi:MAG: 50S ribosomal protein L5 [Parcubacteria group bacterium]|nr:50S ribosomal protein L5 [Parcubacteria group bacterium]
MKHLTTKDKEYAAYDALKERFGYTNRLAAPRLVKVIVSVGTGKASRADATRNDFIAERLAKITGQKAAPRGAKKSIASFKVRAGEPIGFAVTLRGSRMYGFLDRLFDIALPRTRDFRGIAPTVIDDMGNATVGIREHTVFPETADEELKNVFGLAVTIVTTARAKDEARAFLERIGMPFKKTEKKA